MKHPKGNSMTSLLRFILAFLWYGQWVIAILIFGKVIINLFSPENTFAWPVSFEAITDTTLTTSAEGFRAPGIQTSEGTLSFSAPMGWGNNTIMFIGLLLTTAPFLIVTYQLRKIMQSIASDEAFIQPNLFRLRYIGIALLVFPALKYVFGFIYVSYLNSHFSGYNFINSAELFPLLLGLLTLILAEVFRTGIAYREENNLTI